MDREKAIQILKRCEAESHCKHYKRHYCCIGCGQREALDLAIEALKEKHQLSRETSTNTPTCNQKQVTSKLKNPHDSLLKPDSDECKEQKSKLDCISRQDAIEALMAHFIPQTYTGEQVEQAEKLAQKIMNKVPPVTPTVKVQQADTLIIATALRDFAQDSERNISDRERAEELREQVLAYGASMCQPVTPTERTGITTDIALSLYEEIRCEALCTNPMKSDRGCDGGCQYDKELLKRIDEVIEKVLVDSPTERTGEWTNTGVLTVHCSNCKSEFHELEAMNYCPNCGAKMKG